MELNASVHISEACYQKIMHWIKKAGSFEVSGLGNVIYDPANRVFLVDEVYLLQQENTGTTTDINDVAVGKLMYEHHKSKRKGELRFWWHSHANMGVFWSQTDISTIKHLSTGGWFLNTVFNAKEEMKTAFYMTEPMAVFADDLSTSIISDIDVGKVKKMFEKMGFTIRKGKINDILWAIEADVSDENRKAWDEEYDAKVSSKKYTPPPYLGKYSKNTGYAGSDVGGSTQSAPWHRNSFSHTDYDDDFGDTWSPTVSSPIAPPSVLNIGKSAEEMGVPSFSSKKKKKESDISEEEMDILKDEINDFITTYDGITSEQIIYMYQDDYPFVDENFLKSNFRRFR